MDPLAMSAVDAARDSAAEYLQKLKKRARLCRPFGHHFTRPDRRNSERISDGGIRFYRHCTDCGLPLIWTYYPKDHTYKTEYDYSAVPGYLRTGEGTLTREERAAMREVALEL
jgi:hypothetical protein